MCCKFCAPYYLKISMWFYVQNVLRQIRPRKSHRLCEEQTYTMAWYEEKTDLKRAWRFIRTNKNSPLIKRFIRGIMYTICMLCVSLCRCDLFVKLITNGRREVKNSLNRKKRVSHVPGNCNEIWIALHLSFPGSYSVERFPEQGFNNNIRQLKHN